MKQQDKKSQLFIAHNSYQTRTIEQEVDALELEGRKVEVTKIKADGWLYIEAGVLLEWGYTKEEEAFHTVTSFLYEQYRYEYDDAPVKLCKKAWSLVGGLIKLKVIVKTFVEIKDEVDKDLKAESEAECRAERGPSCENWGAPHPYDYL